MLPEGPQPPIQLVGETSLVLLRRLIEEVPLVEDHPHTTAALPGERQNAGVLFRDPRVGVE